MRSRKLHKLFLIGFLIVPDPWVLLIFIQGRGRGRERRQKDMRIVKLPLADFVSDFCKALLVHLSTDAICPDVGVYMYIYVLWFQNTSN